MVKSNQIFYFCIKIFNIFNHILIKIWPFILYFFITYIIFFHRFEYITQAYGMSGVDTDGTLWYYWAKSLSIENDFNFKTIDLIAFPIGYNVDYIPFANLLYNFIIFVLNITEGYKDINAIIFLSNLFSLICYPLHAFFTYLLIKYLTNNTFASFIAGLISGFSYYFVLMGRGALSLNHVYWIPLTLLLLYKSIREKSNAYILLSGASYSMLFANNAYWGFFSGIFISIIILYEVFFIYSMPLMQKLIFVSKYVVSYILFIILFNFNFFVNYFETSKKFNNSRPIIPYNELISFLEYMKPSETNVIYTFGDGKGWFLGFFSMGVALLGFVFIKNKQSLNQYIFITFNFLISLLLSANIAGFNWINDIYFRYFGMFRAVSRLNVIATLFLAIMAGFTIKSILNSKICSNIMAKYIFYIMFLFIGFGIILEGLNNDQSWRELTFVNPIKETYSVVRDDSSIKSIAQYPMPLQGGGDGFAPNYQLIAQIIHGKKLVAGADPYNEDGISYYNKIKDIEDPQTIDILISNNVDAIIINKKFLSNGDDIVNKLMQDRRIRYVGTYSGSFEKYIQKGERISYGNYGNAHIDLFKLNSTYNDN